MVPGKGHKGEHVLFGVAHRSGEFREPLAQGVRDLAPRVDGGLVAFLMEHAGEVVTRTMLLEQVWEFHFEPKTSVVETHVSRLRAKIDKPFEIELIHTIRGAGYAISAPQ